MLVKTFTGTTSQKEKINQPIAMFALKATGTNVDLTGVTATIRLVNSDGKGTILCRNYPLDMLSILSTIGEGYGTNDVENDGQGGLNITKSIRFIQIGYKGGLALVKDEYLEIELKGLIANDTYNLYGIQYGTLTSDARFYDTIDVDGAVNNRNFDVSDYDIVVFDKTKITEFIGNLDNGKNIDVTTGELEIMQTLLNDKNVMTIAAQYELNNPTYRGLVIFPLNYTNDVKVESIDLDSNAETDIWTSNVKPVSRDKSEHYARQTLVANSLPNFKN